MDLKVFGVFEVFGRFGEVFANGGKVFGFLQGSVMVWDEYISKPLSFHAKTTKTFPSFAQTFPNFAKTKNRKKIKKKHRGGF